MKIKKFVYSTICLLFIVLYLSCEIDNNENIVPTEKNSDSSLIVIYNGETISPDETNITIFLPIGSNANSVSFTLEVGKGATLQDGNDAILPLNESNQYSTNIDFSGGATHDFKVTAQNGSITIYTVKVQLRDSKKIISFTFLRKDNLHLETDIVMDINSNSQTVNKTVTNVERTTGLIPTIVHNGSNVSPASGVAQNFSTNNTYTVTAFDGNISIYTVSLTRYYGVIFNANGGLISGDPTATEYILYREKASPPSNPSREHYGFKGWYDAPNGGNTFDFDTPITTQTTVYAQWTNKQYRVKFYRGASLLENALVASLAVIPTSDYPVSPNAGKAYRWHSNANLGGVFNKDSLLIADINLYAQEVPASFEMIIENRMIPTDLVNYGKMSEEIFSNYTLEAMVTPRYVKATASGTGDGSSWGNASGDIQAIIDLITDASENKIYIVLMASGTYKPAASYAMKNHVALVGGFAVGGYDRSGETLLDGDNDKGVFYNYNLDRTALFYGVVITNGNGNLTEGSGGMYNNNSSPTLINVTFSGNKAGFGSGGGMHNNNSSPTLINVTFSGNMAFDGGGMHNNNSSPTLINVTFSDNEAFDGGGIFNNNSSPTLINVTFSDNTAKGFVGGSGGGMRNRDSSPTLINVTFSDNEAISGGGMRNISSSPTLINVTFSDNEADFGGGIRNTSSSFTLINVTFSGNEADFGGGMLNESSSSILINITFLSNTAGNGGGIYHDSDGQPLTLINTILWNNNNENIYLYNNNTNTDTVNLYHSLIEGGTNTSTNAVGIRLYTDDIIANPISINSEGVIDEDPGLGILADNGGRVNTIPINSSSPVKDKGIYVRGVKSETGNPYPETNLYYSENNTDWYSDPSLTTQESPPSDADDLTATDARGYGRVGRPDMGVYEEGGVAP